MKKVTIIIRTKDRILLLERAIKSILKQTFKDWNIVIINNGENDDKIICLINNYFEKMINCVKVININKETCIDSLINIGIQNSQSEYIVVLDDDDTWEKDFLYESISFLDNDSNYDGVVTQTTLINEYVNNNKIVEISRKVFNPRLKKINKFYLLRCNRFTTNAFVFRRNSLKKTGIYRNDLYVLGDWEFNLRFIFSGNKIYVIKKPLANYHKRKNNNDNLRSYNNTEISLHIYYDWKIRREYLYKLIKDKKIHYGILIYIFGYINSFFRFIKKLIFYFNKK